MDDKMKICDSCGKELPLTQFQSWTKKDGSISHLHQCLKCQRDKANRNYSNKKKFGEISKFEDNIIIQELKRRGYMVKNIKDMEV